ncbi:MAG: hypothetical protein ACFFDN_15075 [Candidatus Hodarchaeota archaeon]
MNITYTLTALGVGTYTFVCGVNDSYGNSVSDTVIVTVQDITPPNLEAGPNDVTLELGAVAGYVLEWNWTDLSANEYNITRNGPMVDSGVWTSGVNITYTLTALGVGIYTFVCGVNDSYGNSASDTVIVTVNDTTGPSYSNLIRISPIYVGDNEIIMINVTDISGVSKVLFEIEGNNYTMVNIGGDTYYNDSWSPGAIGSYPFNIYMNDTLNNWNNVSGSILVIVPVADPTPPTVNITFPSSGWYFINNTVKIIGYVNGTGSNITSVEINRDDLFELTVSPILTLENPYEFTNKTDIPSGVYNIIITVKDTNLTNSANASVMFIVDYDTPQIFIDFAAIQGEAGINYTINVTIIDSDPFLTALIAYFIMGITGSDANITMTRQSSTTFTGDIPGTVDYGLRVAFIVIARDTPGHTSWTAQVEFNVNDTTAPKITAIRMSRLPFIRPGESVLLEIEVADEEFGAPINKVEVWYSAGLPWSSFRMTEGSPYRVIFPPMPAGMVLTYYFNVTDAAGNSIVSDKFVTVVLPEELAFNILFTLGTMVGAAVIGAAAMISSRRHEQETTKKWKRLVAITGTAQTKATLREEALRRRLRERAGRGLSWPFKLFILIFCIISTFALLVELGVINMLLSFLLPPSANILNIIFIGIMSTVVSGVTSFTIIRKRKRTISKKAIVGKKSLDKTLRNIIDSNIPLKSIKNQSIKNFFKHDFTILSVTEINRVLKLNIPTIEQIIILKELAGLSPEEREKFLDAIEKV